MKKLLYIIVLITFLSGCNKDYLEVPPLDRISETAVWADEKLVQAYVNSQYSLIVSHFGGENENLHRYTDEAFSQYNFGTADAFRKGALTQDIGLSGTLNYWETGFSYLRNINVFFDKIDQTNDFDLENVSAMKGEMAFLRAYIYEAFLYSYGGVPIVDYLFNLDDELSGVTRDSYENVFQFIVDDLDYVINESSLPDMQSGSNWGRVSKDIARAFKARLLLRDASKHYNTSNDQTKWQAASDAAWELIQSGRYQLWTGDYREMFLLKENGESIWQKCYNSSSSHNYPYRNNASNVGGYGVDQPSENLSRAYEMTNGELPYMEADEASLTPNVNPESGFDPDKYWENRDVRWHALFGYNGRSWSGSTIYTYEGVVQQDKALTGYHTVRYIDPAGPWSENFPYTTPWTLIRYAEIILNYAEAQFELGHEDIARQYLNKIRQRAGQPDIPDTVTGEDLRDKIYHERRVEFPFEGLRYFDIRRWEIAEEVMTKPLIGMVIENLGTTVSPGPFSYSFIELLPGFWDDKYYNVPIPYSEILRSNFSLEQNSGY